MPITLDQMLHAPWLRGLTPWETGLIRRFLLEHGSKFSAFECQQYLGIGEDPGPKWPMYVRQQAIQVSQKRADLVAYQDNGVWIFEVKVSAGLSSLGQLMGYEVLWRQQYPELPVLQLALIAHHLPESTRLVLDTHKVLYFVYPEVERPPRRGPAMTAETVTP